MLARDIEEDPNDFLSLIVSEEAKNELMVELLLAVAVDGEISPAEMNLLNRVAEVLDVSGGDLALLLKAAIA